MTRENPTGSELIRNLIPDDMRLIDSQSGENFTGANYLTRTVAGQVVTVTTPSGQAVPPGTDLIQIANDFDNTVKSELDADSFQIPAALLRNSLKSGVTDFFPVESLTITSPNNELGKTKVFDANQGQSESVFGRIWGASLGALQDKLVDADDADNLIEVEPVDAAKLGGPRAWAGNDLILGTDPDLDLGGTHDGNDIVNGNGGSDKIVGAGGKDLLMGGQGNDFIAGGKDDDLLMGQKGNDEVFGGEGNDVIGGGSGADLLMGNDGNDILISGGGDEGDFLIGAEGADEFILRTETLATDAALANRILDFTLAKTRSKLPTSTAPKPCFQSVSLTLMST